MTQAPATVQRRALLKAATESLHSRLDAAVGKLDLADRAQYRRFLEASAAALLPLEELLTRSDVAGLLPDWSRRRRGDALLTDLAAVGGASRPIALDRQTLGPEEVMGVLYVLEGSRLGARVVGQRVTKDVDAHYLGAADTALWRSFLQLLESSEAPWDGNETVDAARWTFGVFQRAFSAI